MTILPITYAPHPIFRETAAPVTEVNDHVRQIIADMFETLYVEEALGLSAPMVGISQRIAIVDLQENGTKNPLSLINPEIVWTSEEMQTHNEASLSFPFISADITRPYSVKIRFLNEQGAAEEQQFEGFLATVIQHEIDYLNGRVFLDHLSRMKREMLLKKMQKLMKLNPPHIHGEHCNH